MGKIKFRDLLTADEREQRIAKAIKAYHSGKYSSLSKTADICGVPRTTLSRRLNGGTTRQLAHTKQQLLTLSEERAIVRWIYNLEASGFPPRIEHVKEAALLLKGKELDENIGKNWMTRFLNRHPQLVTKFSSQFDKKRIVANDPALISDHFRKIAKLKQEFGITDPLTYNMDEKGFLQGVSDRAKVVCLRQVRGMSAKVATDGNRELITVIECVCGDGTTLPPLIVYRGAHHYMGWYNKLTKEAKDYKFSYSPKGWSNRFISLDWLKHFDERTKEKAKGAWRLVILDGHDSHVTIEFIEYAIHSRIKIYCLPPHTTHLLQPLDVGLFSPLQKFYGKQVDKLTRFGQITVNKGNFLPMLIAARNSTYTLNNIKSAWQASGLIPHNPRLVLGKLVHGKKHQISILQEKNQPPPTPRNTLELARRTRKARMMLNQSPSHLNRQELADLIDRLHRFGLAADNDRRLEHDTFLKWQNTQKLATKPDKRKLGKELGRVLDGGTLLALYKTRERKEEQAAAKAAKKAAGRRSSLGASNLVSSTRNRTRKASFDSEDDDGSFDSSIDEIGQWTDEESDGESSIHSVIVCTPRRPINRVIFVTPTPQPTSPIDSPPSVTPSPAPPLVQTTRVLRSRSVAL